MFIRTSLGNTNTFLSLSPAWAAAAAAFDLKQQGFTPDLICAHPGWGEALFLKQIWPDCPLLCYQEFFYRNQGFDLGFDPELQGACDWRSEARSHMKNAYLLHTLEAANWNVTPTGFQLSSFPSHWQGRISAIHDGIDSRRAAPVVDLLTNRDRARSLAEKGRETIQARYSLDRCVPRQLALMDLVASGAICRLDPWAGSANQWQRAPFLPPTTAGRDGYSN